MCTESSTAIGIKKTGIMLDMMWTVKPVPMSRPMPQTTLNMATAMQGRIKGKFRNRIQSKRRIAIPASGATIPICRNISTPNVSSATGSPAR